MNRNFTAAILIVLSVALYITFTAGQIDAARSTQAVNAQYANAITNAEKLIGVRDRVLKDYNNVSAEDKAQLDKMLPNTVDNIRLIIDLNNIAVQHGFNLKNVSAATKAASAQGGPILTSNGRQASAAIAIPVRDTVSVSFSVSAPYQQFISFMQDLEANLRLMDITHLTVTANTNGAYDFTVQLNTYWLHQ